MKTRFQLFINRSGALAASWAERFLPDPWIYAILLTVTAYCAALLLTEATAWETASAWHDGLWDRSILTLVAQFSINLILCTALARTPLLKRALARLARMPATAPQAIWLIALISVALSLISWSFCVIGGVLFARETCQQASKRGLQLHYPLAVAAGYVGMLTWGCGFTSSAVLITASPGHFLEPMIGIVPISQTLGSWSNLLILAVLAVGAPLLLATMHPQESIVECEENPAPENESANKPSTPAERLEASSVVLKIGSLLPLSYFIHYFFIQRAGLTIDSMNLIFLVATLLLYRTPRDMMEQLSRSSQGVWAIVFQFPFYSGLLGLIRETGLGGVLADRFIAVSTELTWPAIGLIFQGTLNLFVPSGGAQWIVSGPILVRTSEVFGYSAAQAILIEVMGDQLTNMVQPMWALPALSLAGLQARQIMGYTAVVMIFAFFVMVVGLTLLPA